MPVITADPDDEFFYEDCGNKTVCHGVPGTCVATKNCRFAVKVKVRDHKFVISMQARRSMYVAVGFTEDQKRVRYIGTENFTTSISSYLLFFVFSCRVMTTLWNVWIIKPKCRLGDRGMFLDFSIIYEWYVNFIA